MAGNDKDMAAALQPDRYYLVNDAGSFYFDPHGENEGFTSPEEALAWARTNPWYPYGTDLDLSDPMSAAIVIGSEWNASDEWAEAWAERGGTIAELDDAPPVHNYAEDLGLVRYGGRRVVGKHRRLLDRLRWR